MKFKYYLLLLSFASMTASIQAQNWNIGDRVKNKVTDRIDKGIDRTIDKTLDEAEKGVKEGSKEQPKTEQKTETAPAPTTTSPAVEGTKQENLDRQQLQAYSKFDFISGEKVIAFEDFMQDAIGDFPARWNTNGSGEIVKLSGQAGKWLQLAERSIIYPEFFPDLAENCTIEMEVAFIGKHSSWFDILLTPYLENFDYRDDIRIRFDPTGEGNSSIFAPNGVANSKNKIPWSQENGAVSKIYIWKQKTRLRVYVNEQKIWDLPRVLDGNSSYKLVFNPWMGDESSTYVTNIRMAIGAADTRSKLITEGKFSTNGILFDVNSDKIKPASYGVLKDIANTLEENPDVKVKIIGHTDSDGDAAKNLELSKRRALSVRDALITEFGIRADRMMTDGKGSSEPIAPNNSSEGKANNRRVEFIKL
jgi:OmpA-OmpF porin, OOP family